MGQHAQGWKLRANEHSGAAYSVRFRHAGKRVERSTGETDPRKAAIEAARIYAEVVSGRKVTRTTVSADLDTLVSGFLAAYQVAHAEGTGQTVETYFRAHLLPHFGSIDRLTAASIGDYMRDRIQVVTRATVRKELSALRQFFAWATEQGVAGLPTVPSLPKYGHDGKRHANARKQVATILTPGEVTQILAAMPERSRRTGNFVRPFWIVYWETGLRPATLLKLEAGTNYTKGGKSLWIGRSQDKAHMGRTIPLTAAARAALDRVVPKSGKGLLFEGMDRHTLRDSLMAAVAKTKIKKPVSVYDIKHSRITDLVNQPDVPLTGVMHLVGHKHLSTTAKYAQSSEKAAAEALAVIERRKPKTKRRAA